MTDVTLTVKQRFLFHLNSVQGIRQWGPADAPMQLPVQQWNPGDETVLTMISVPLNTLQLFAQDCQWLQHIAKFLFNVPGQVTRQQGQNWVAVLPNQAIQAVEYRFQPTYVGGLSIYLTRYMVAAQTLVPDLQNMAGQQAPNYKGTDFDAGVETREDNRCIISKLHRRTYPSVHSHLIPKALGPIGVQHVLQRFMGPNPPAWAGNANFPEWDYHIGILLFRNYDSSVNDFTLGFYRPANPGLGVNGVYVAHHFTTPDAPNNVQITGNTPGWTKIGLKWADLANAGVVPTQQQLQDWNLHGCNINFNGRQVLANYKEPPPWEVLSWHYLQCVLRQWGHGDYRDFANITW